MCIHETAAGGYSIKHRSKSRGKEVSTLSLSSALSVSCYLSPSLYVSVCGWGLLAFFFLVCSLIATIRGRLWWLLTDWTGPRDVAPGDGGAINLSRYLDGCAASTQPKSANSPQASVWSKRWWILSFLLAVLLLLLLSTKCREDYFHLRSAASGRTKYMSCTPYACATNFNLIPTPSSCCWKYKTWRVLLLSTPPSKPPLWGRRKKSVCSKDALTRSLEPSPGIYQ